MPSKVLGGYYSLLRRLQMERSIAIRKLHKILGKGFGYRENHKALDKAGREAARAELKAANAERESLRAAADARRNEILAQDQDYQTKLAAYQAARKRAERLMSHTHSYRVTVGTCSNAGGFGFFHVKAEGDNWQEVFDKVTKA
jgi:uncharacterized protein YqfA (UPF0365 family)